MKMALKTILSVGIILYLTSFGECIFEGGYAGVMYILDETENGTVVNALNMPEGVPTDVLGLFPNDARDIAYRELTKEFIFVTDDGVFAKDPITGGNRLLLSIDDIPEDDEPVDTTLLAVDPDRSVIMKVNITDGEAETETFGPWPSLTISTIAFDPVEQLVYFSDPIGRKTLRLSLTGNNSEYISETDGATVMRFNQLDRRLYMTHETDRVVKVMDLNGTVTILLDRFLKLPHALAIAAAQQYIFFSEVGRPSIERISLDGSNRTRLLKRPAIGSVYGLHNNEVEGLIYASELDGRILRCDYNGGAFEIFVESENLGADLEVNAIFVDGSNIFVTANEMGLGFKGRTSAQLLQFLINTELTNATDILYYSATPISSRRRRSLSDFSEPESRTRRVRRSVAHENEFYGVAVDNTHDKIFVQYLDNEPTWNVFELLDDGENVSISISASVPYSTDRARIQLIPRRSEISLGGQNGIYVGSYSNLNFSECCGPASDILTQATHEKRPLGVWIAVNESSTLGYTVLDGTYLDEGEVTLDLNDATLGGVGFYGDFLLLSVPEGNGTDHTIHYGTLSDLNFTYVGKLSPDAFGWVGRGTPLRYLLVDSYCPYSAPSATVLVSPAAVLLRDYNSHYYKRNSNFGKPAPFKRFLETGQPDQMPSYSSSDDGTISFNPVKRKNRKWITGVFAHSFISDDYSTLYGTIIVPVQFAGRFAFSKPTLTVYPGDDVPLSIPNPKSSNIVWYSHISGDYINMWRNTKSVVISNVTSADAGVYEVFLLNRRKRKQQGFVRIIVQECPRGYINPPHCNVTSSRECLNGGILDQLNDECICAPGFVGCDCENILPRGFYGQEGSSYCVNMNCDRTLICQFDPYGCSCAPGFTGQGCFSACPTGSYGASCVSTCHCMDNTKCDRFTGQCGASGCAPGWTGPNCQLSVSVQGVLP